MKPTTYTKITYSNGNSEFGAFIDCGYGKTATPKPQVGDTVVVTTKNGEKHTRIIRRIITEYKSGVKVVFVKDEQIEATAKARYDAKAAEFKAEKSANTPAPLSAESKLSNAQKAKIYDDLHNEGGEGFNPYR